MSFSLGTAVTREGRRGRATKETNDKSYDLRHPHSARNSADYVSEVPKRPTTADGEVSSPGECLSKISKLLCRASHSPGDEKKQPYQDTDTGLTELVEVKEVYGIWRMISFV